MNLTKSSNPAFGRSVFNTQAVSYGQSEVMTLNGAINKSILLLGLVLTGAIYTWKMYFDAVSVGASTSAVTTWMAIGGIGGFILSLITIFKHQWAYWSAPLYAVLEGLFLGAISAFFESMYPGLVMQAVALTFGVFLIMLLGYRSGIIKVTQKFRAGIIGATGAVVLVYFISFIMSMFGTGPGLIHSNGTFGIVISLVVVAIAALNLVLDFDFIVKGSQAGMPKHMEWYGAFGLMITLVWLYIEILRLLAKLASRD